MGRQARSKVIDPASIQILHCSYKCVRGAFLCGKNEQTGEEFDHRRGWIRSRLEFLASIYGIDILTYSVMSNHTHIVVRSRHDVVKTWSDEEIALNWLRLYPGWHNGKKGDADHPKQSEIDKILNNPQRLLELRQRLSDVSWLMRGFAENISKRSNEEDGRSGHFWADRFHCQLLLDEASLLACVMYVDLNPIRAAMAKTPETSLYTGAKDRLDDTATKSGSFQKFDPQWECMGACPKSGWLSPIQLVQSLPTNDPQPETTGRRASRKGFLSLTLIEYLQLLDWTGRTIRNDKRGAIPNHLPPILERIGLDVDRWCQLTTCFGKLFKRAAGSTENLAAEAQRRGQRWMQGPGGHLIAAS